MRSFNLCFTRSLAHWAPLVVIGSLLTSLLAVSVAAAAERCVGIRPIDVCEQGVAQRLSAADSGRQDKTGPSEKIATPIREAIEAIYTYAHGQGTSALSALSTDVVHINDAAEIHAYIVLRDFEAAHVALLEALGIGVELTLPEFRLVQAWVPAILVDLVAGLDFVVEVKPPGYPIPQVGAQTTAGDSILRADSARASFGVSGLGVTVGVMSSGVDHLANSVTTGDLPTNVNVLKNAGGDEGTAMLEIVHDLAPGAALAYYGPTTSADMVSGINSLAAAGAKVIVDDIIFADEPKFQDGMIAQTARNFATAGKVYVTAAGNEAQSHYRATYNRLTGQNFPNATYPGVHNFASSSSPDPGNTFNIPNNCKIGVILQWNNPNGASADDFDLFLGRSVDSAILALSIGTQSGTQNAYESLSYTNTSGAAVTVFIAVAEYKLVTAPSSLILDYFVHEQCGIGSFSGFQYVTAADSVIGHAAVNEVLSVAALPASAPTTVEPYSSRGPGSISFPTPGSRSVPNISGIDCVATEVGAAGFFPVSFCGTSAAAPHIAGVAALLMERNPTLTSQQLRDLITGNAVDLGASGFDFTFGFGRADAYAAVSATTSQSSTLSVNKSGTGTGTVTSSPSGIACGATCLASFNSGSTVTLTAAPDVNSTLGGWSGCDSASGMSCTVTMSASRAVTATFTLVGFNYTLGNSGSITVTAGASGANTITATLTGSPTQSVSFSATGLPTGATAAFSSTACTPTCSTQLTISTTASTAPSSYPITVTGSPLGKTTQFTLTVQSGFNGDLRSNPIVITTESFSDTRSTTNYTSSSDDPVHSCTGHQDGHTIWYQFTPTRAGTATITTATSGYDTVLSVYQGSGEVACNDDVAYPTNLTSRVQVNLAANSTYLIEISSFGSTVGGSLALSLSFAPSGAFNYTLGNSGPITVTAGASGANTITATLTGGPTQSVSFSATGLPTGATAAFGPTACNPTCSTQLTISTTASTAPGSYTITVTGSPLGKTTQFTLTVGPPPPRAKTFTVPPCRVLDTRLSNPVGPVPANGTRSILVAGDLTGGGTVQQGGATNCGVPDAATGVFVNVVAVTAAGPGHLTVYPFGTSLPVASTLNFTTGQTVANGVLVPICVPTVSCALDLNITMGPAGADLVIDVTGYLAPFP
jgi:hypothetical protein